MMLAGAALPGAASAQEFCSEPVAPYCADKDGDFDTVLQVNRCRDDLNDYEQQLKEYESCITQQLGSLREELKSAREMLEEAEKKF